MSDYASLLATIAGLQEQIDSMNGQLTEVRPFFICSCPFPQRALRARRAPRPAAPTAAAASPRGGAAGAAITPSPARRGRRGRTRDYKCARATTNPRARPQS